MAKGRRERPHEEFWWEQPTGGSPRRDVEEEEEEQDLPNPFDRTGRAVEIDKLIK